VRTKVGVFDTKVGVFDTKVGINFICFELLIIIVFKIIYLKLFRKYS